MEMQAEKNDKSELLSCVAPHWLKWRFALSEITVGIATLASE